MKMEMSFNSSCSLCSCPPSGSSHVQHRVPESCSFKLTAGKEESESQRDFGFRLLLLFSPKESHSISFKSTLYSDSVSVHCMLCGLSTNTIDPVMFVPRHDRTLREEPSTTMPVYFITSIPIESELSEKSKWYFRS
ncbi:hypothetical protein BLNAU_18691 [Blattamonas nauphoetae]|uniref:Uncharacterized protein n=1 Tax=Blattamonas nauphoetae TaxID=2049346 RepID=A0ABQ9WPV2_9EUKA|nr:hypothetical protein BLNAU_24319 [Blattamonas nauphoetae]KAK2946330.1 hypothetical protein BLNAU_18691 [Blattamonas nauphoetae]